MIIIHLLIKNKIKYEIISKNNIRNYSNNAVNQISIIDMFVRSWHKFILIQIVNANFPRYIMNLRTYKTNNSFS